MAIPTIRYELDTTGENLNNKVVGEIRTLSENDLRAVAPSYGAYFAESLIVKDNVTQLPLARNTDYYCVELLQEASAAYGKEICYLILIVNQNVTEVKFDYQVLGGLYTRSADKIVDLYEKLKIDDRPVDWVKILNKPYEYNPTKHLHDLKDVYGFQYLIDSLERIRSAILIGSAQANQELIDWINSRFNAQPTAMKSNWAEINNSLISFIENKPDSLVKIGGITSGTGALTRLANNSWVLTEIKQSDWNQTDTGAQDFIKNKPDLLNLRAVSADVSGIVNNTPLQELGGVDKLINGVRIGRGGGNLTNNVVLGPNALTANISGSGIVAIGINSMSGNTVGNDNIGIGKDAGNTITIGNNNIVIGSGAQASAATVSNEITLGNNNTTNTRLRGALSVGNTTPDPGTLNKILTSSGPNIAPTWKDSAILSKLTLNGPTVSSLDGSFTVYEDLATYNVSAPNTLGTVRIGLPFGWTSTMFSILIEGYDYSPIGSWSIEIFGYAYGVGYFVNTGIRTNGRIPFSNFRLGYDTATSKCVILLGTTTTNLSYPKIRVRKALLGHQAFANIETGWDITRLTTETGLDQLVNLSPDIIANSVGNIGIGTSSPAYKLVVSAAGASGIEFGPAYSGTSNIIQSYNRSGGAYVNTVYDAAAHVFNTSGAEKMRIDSSGNLGLGVTPSAWVDDNAVQLPHGSVSSGYEYGISTTANAYRSASNVWRYTTGQTAFRANINNSGFQWFTAPSGTAGNAISFTQAMTLTAAGNLGIGTTIPSARLDIQAASTAAPGVASALTLRQSSDGGLSLNFVNGVTTNANPLASIRALPLAAGSGTDDGILSFSTSSDAITSERVRIDSNGNLIIGSIGNETASQQLTFTSGTSGIGLGWGTTLANYTNIWSAFSSGDLVMGSGVYGSKSTDTYLSSFDGSIGRAAIRTTLSGNITFSTASGSTAARGTAVTVSERMRIDSSGNLQVGMTSGSRRINASFTAASGGIYLETTNADASYLYFARSGATFVEQKIVSTNFQIVNLGSGGVSLATGGTSWSAVSDERLKTVIVPFKNASAKVASLRAGTGRYLTDNEKISRSFLIAQDVEVVLPEAVDIGSDEQKTLSLRYSDVIPLLVADSQEKQNIIDNLVAELQSLRLRVAALEAK